MIVFLFGIFRILTALTVVTYGCVTISVAFQGTTSNSIGSDANTSTQETTLRLGDSVDGELTKGTHSYRLELSADQFFRIRVEQMGADVALSIKEPDGTKSPEIDRPNGTRGKDWISWIARTSGAYILQLRLIDGSGKYRLTVETIRPVGPDDLLRITAEQAVSEGETLRYKDSPESIRSGIEKFKKAIALWNTLHDDYEEAVALYGRGFALQAIGENQQAINDFNQALTLFGDDGYSRAFTSAGLGFPLMYLGDYEGAMRSFNLALQLSRPAQSVKVEGVALYGLGWTHAFRGEYEAALQNFSESLKLRQAAKEARSEALSLTGIGKVELLMGHKERAQVYLLRALERLPKSKGNAKVQGDILSNLGWVSRSLNENSAALDYFNHALPLRQGDRIGEATTLYGISTISQRLGKFEESIVAIEAALEIIESLRTRGLNQQLRLSYFASIQDYYDFYIYLLMRLDKLRPGQGYAAKALHACERARARSLIDLLAENQIDLRHGVDASLLAAERRVDQELSDAVERQYQKQSDPGADESAQVHSLVGQREALRAQIREASPSYAAIVQPQPLTAREIQELVLDNETVLLEYALGEDESYLWIVTVQEIFSYRLPGRVDIERRARTLNESLLARDQIVSNESAAKKRSRITEADTRATVVSHELGQILLSPIAGRFAGKRLLIVAPDILQYVPFAALVDPRSPTSPLINDHELVVLPSATTVSVLRAHIKSRMPQPNLVAAFGDPVFGPLDERVASILSRKRGITDPPPTSTAAASVPSPTTTFSRLLSSRWEATQIASMVSAKNRKLFLDFDASRQIVTGDDISRFRFIHFATHAIVDNQHPELSGIVLSMVDKTGRSQNGFLSANEIFDLKLPAELIVLSACRTGLGKEFKGEGLVGLTRAFMYAGAARVVVSLWDVDDKPTSELMVRFYRHMLGPEKLRPAAALRQAQLEMSRDPRWRSPYFWAAFVLQGEWK
jgi:CHAT domain-containing protein/Flp pilus assembly protein TadD